jgi:hypothetical protein
MENLHQSGRKIRSICTRFDYFDNGQSVGFSIDNVACPAAGIFLASLSVS